MCQPYVSTLYRISIYVSTLQNKSMHMCPPTEYIERTVVKGQNYEAYRTTDCRRTEKSSTGPNYSLMKGTWDNSTEGVYLAPNSPNTQFVGEK